VKRLKLTQRTKTNKLPKWGILKYLSAQNLNNVKRLKCPWGKNDSDWLRCKAKTIFVQNLIKDLCRPIEKTQGRIVGTENGFLCRKWPKYPFVWFYAKNLKDWSSNVCSWSTIENTVNLKVLENSKGNWMSIFRSKMRVWQLPLFKFLRLESQETESLAWHDEDT